MAEAEVVSEKQGRKNLNEQRKQSETCLTSVFLMC